MMDMGTVVIIAIVAFFVGVLGGFLLSKATGGNGSVGNLKNQMDSLQERFTSYQGEVASHFSATATIANKISQDYLEMQGHLVHSIESLVADEELRAKLLMGIQTDSAKALDHAPEQPVADDNKIAVTAYNDVPKDYAPKTHGEIGTLAEEFNVKHQ